MFTPDELRALSLLLVLVALGACLRLVEARHPRFLTLTLGDSPFSQMILCAIR